MNEALVLKPGSVLDTSWKRGGLKGMTRENSSYVGRKVEQHRVIRALNDRKKPVPLVHIRGVDHVGKTRFVKEVCYFFYRSNKFRNVIMFRDLSKIETPKEFKELMDALNKEIEKRPSSDNMSSVDTGSLEEYQDEKGVFPIQDILFAFTNADKMKRDFWQRLESRLLDIYQNKPSVRYIVTSSSESRKFFFSHFTREEENQSADSQDRFRRSSTFTNIAPKV